jgi:lipopolysaccharide export system protein LptA
MTYNGQTDIFEAKGRVFSKFLDLRTRDQIKLKSAYLKSYVAKKLVVLTGNVRGDIKRRKRYEGGLKFSAEKVVFNSLNSQLNLDSNVKIRRNKFYLRSGSAEIFLENYNKKLKYYVLYDDVKLEERLVLDNGKSQLRKAFAEKLEGILSSGEIILTGAPRVEQANDVIKGYQITLRENIELIEVDDAQSSFRLKKD